MYPFTPVWRSLAIALLALSLAPSPAAARQAAEGAEFDSLELPGWSFVPSVAMGILHDSNVALASPRADLGRTQGDTLLSVVPGGAFEFSGRRTGFVAGYRGFLRRYFEAEGLDGYNQRAWLSFRRTLSRRWTAYARNSFADSPTTDEVELNGVPFRRTGSRTSTAAAGTSYQVTRLFAVGTRYDFTWVTFERPDEFLRGGYIHALTGDATRRLTRRISVGGEYSYRWAELDGGERELTFQDAGGVLRIALGPNTSASAATGLGSLRDRTRGETRSGPFVRLGVSHELPHARVGASFDRQYVPSFGFGGASSSQMVRAYGLLPLAPIGLRRATAQGSVTWRRTAPFEEASLQADTMWLRSSIGFLLTRTWRLEGYYNYTRQDSIVTGGEVDRHRAGLQFVISQPMRLH